MVACRMNGHCSGKTITWTLTLFLTVVGAAMIAYYGLKHREKRTENEWRLVYEDDFSGAEVKDGWRFDGGGWKIEDGAMVVTEGAWLAYLPVRVAMPVAVEYTGWVPEGTPAREFSCYLMTEPKIGVNGGYFFGWGAHENWCAKVERDGADILRIGGKYVNPGTRYRFRLELKGGLLKVFVDGKPFLENRDLFGLAKKGDRIALYSWGTGAHFDDVKVFMGQPSPMVSVLAGGDALFRAGAYEKSAAEYVHLIPWLTGDLQKEATLKAGLSYLGIARAEAKKPEKERNLKTVQENLAAASKHLSEVREGEFAAAAVTGLAQVMLEYGSAAKAAEIVRNKVAEDPSSPASWEIRLWPLLTAQDLQKRFRAEEAIVLYDTAATLPGQDGFSIVSALRNAGQILQAVGRYEEALDRHKRIEAEYPDQRWLCASARRSQANILWRMGRPDEAFKALESVEADYPDQREQGASARQDRASMLRAAGKTEEAIEVLKSIEADYPDLQRASADARLARAAILQATGRIDEALETLETVERDFKFYHVGCSSARLSRGTILADMGEIESGVEILQSIERDYPEQRSSCAWARHGQGLLLRRNGKFQEALQTFRSVEKDFPDRPSTCAEAIKEAGNSLHAMGMTAEALSTLKSVETKYPDQRGACAEARLNQGLMARDMGTLANALNIFMTIENDYRDQQSTCAASRKEAGVVLRMMNGFDEAVRSFEAVEKDYREQSFHCAASRLERGYTLGITGKIDDALGILSSIEKDFQTQRGVCAKARRARGRLLEASGELEEALSVFASVETDYKDQREQCAGARLDQSLSLARAGRFDEAIGILASIETDYKDQRKHAAWARLSRALVMCIAGRGEETMRVFESVSRDFQDQREQCVEALVFAGAYLGASARSDQFLVQASEFNDHPRFKTAAEFLLGHITEQEFLRIMKASFWQADAEYWCGEKALRIGNYQKAFEHFKNTLDAKPGLAEEFWPFFGTSIRLQKLQQDGT